MQKTTTLKGSHKSLQEAAFPFGIHDELDYLPMTDENKKMLLKIVESIKPARELPIGKIIIYGTAGEIDNSRFIDLFTNHL